MARRSAMNNRYQKGTTPKGATKKSAASAKPKRSTDDSGPGGKSRKDYKKKSSKKSSFLREMPDTAEYKKLRKVWWYCLGAAFVFLIASLLLGAAAVQEALGIDVDTANSIAMALTWIALLAVAMSWYFDFKKIRPLVKEFDEQRKSGKSGKAKTDDTSPKSDKADKADKPAKSAKSEAAEKADKTDQSDEKKKN
jgi:hypothetical protein